MDQRPFGWLGFLGFLGLWGFYIPALFAFFALSRARFAGGPVRRARSVTWCAAEPSLRHDAAGNVRRTVEVPGEVPAAKVRRTHGGPPRTGSRLSPASAGLRIRSDFAGGRPAYRRVVRSR